MHSGCRRKDLKCFINFVFSTMNLKTQIGQISFPEGLKCFVLFLNTQWHNDKGLQFPIDLGSNSRSATFPLRASVSPSVKGAKSSHPPKVL